MAGLDQQIAMLTSQRQQLRNKSRSIRENYKLAVVKDEIGELSKSLDKLRREKWLCMDIEKRSGIMYEKIRHVHENVRNSKPEPSVQNRNSVSR
jgi:hypothetical protein